MDRLLNYKAMTYCRKITNYSYSKPDVVGFMPDFTEVHYNILKNSILSLDISSEWEEATIEELDSAYKAYKSLRAIYCERDFLIADSRCKIDELISLSRKAIESLDELNQCYKELQFIEREIKKKCAIDWADKLTDPTSVRSGRTEFALLVKACGLAPYRSTNYPIVSTSLFTQEFQSLYRNQDMALIYPMKEENLVFMSKSDSGVLAEEISCNLEQLMYWPFVLGDWVVHGAFNQNDAFMSFDRFRETAKKHEISEIVLDAKEPPIGVLLVYDNDKGIREKAEAYATLMDLPLVRYCKEANKIYV